MAKFPNMKMTQQGMDMLARAGSGKTEDRLIITHVMLGDGQFDGEIRTLTDVVSPKKEVTLASYLNLGNGKAQCEFIYNNEGIKTGFYHREVGLYGKNGDDGTVKLISYSNAGNYTSYIADESEIMPYQTLRIGIAIGDNDNVTGLIDVNNALTLEKYYILLDEHNKDSEAHGTAIDAKLEDHNEAEDAHEPAFTAKFKAHNEDTDAHKDFVGATASAAGVRGMVPAPPAGAQDMALMGNGTYAYAAINLLQRSKTYAVGDYAYSPNLPSWGYLECVTAGTTAATEPSLPNTINSVVTDGTASFKLYHVALQSQPVGTVRDFTVEFNPNESWGGTWSKMDAGRVLVAAGTYKEGSDSYTYNLGDKGGEAKHQLTTDELPPHTHEATISTIALTGDFNGYGFLRDANGIGQGILSVGNFGAYNHPDTISGYGYNTGSVHADATHSHDITIGNTGGGNGHENRMPYEAVVRWKRTA